MTKPVTTVFSKLPPLSLYIHIPWCVRKCPYCDFNSHTFQDKIPEAEYLSSLQQDLFADLAFIQNRKLQSVFFGGGTPSLMSASFVESILGFTEQRIGFCEDIEITLEANPGTVEQKKFSEFNQAGINRLSIGVQSFSAEKLSRLGRIHTADEASRAAESAVNAGLENFNIDLMHGLESQTADDALEDLQHAMSLAPKHISWYQLTIEPNTIFYKSPPTLPEESVLERIENQGKQLLADHGFVQYEVSAYARAGAQSKHNLNYWQFGDYLGIGAGAHGKITLVDQQQIVRTNKTRLPQHYLNSANNSTQHVIGTQDIPMEFFMNALRLNHGFTNQLFEERTGLPFSQIESKLEEMSKLGLLAITARDKLKFITLSPQGRRFLDTVLTALSD